jgi:hypothetical protein
MVCARIRPPEDKVVSKDSSELAVQFLLIGDLAEISFNPALPDGLTYLDEASQVEIKIAPAKAEIDAFRPLICRAYVSLPCSAAAHKFIASLLQKKFEVYDGMPITLPYSRYDRAVINENGTIAEGFGVPFELYPPEVQVLCDTARDLLKRPPKGLFGFCDGSRTSMVLIGFLMAIPRYIGKSMGKTTGL